MLRCREQMISINSASSPESLWLHVSRGPLDLAVSEAGPASSLWPRPGLLPSGLASFSDPPASKASLFQPLSRCLPPGWPTSCLCGPSSSLLLFHWLLKSGSWSMTTHYSLNSVIFIADAPPAPPSAWWITEVWIVVRADYQLFIHSVIFIECVMITSVLMTCIASVHPGEGSSSVALLKGSSLFSLWKVFLLFLGTSSWSDEVKGQGCRVCVQILKPSEANLWIGAIYNKLNLS